MSEIGASWNKEGSRYWETDASGRNKPISKDEFFRRMEAAVDSDGGASGRERPVGSETEGDGTTPASPPPGTASAQQLADRVRDALNDLYHYTADAVGGIPRRLAPGRSQMHEEGIKALAALVAHAETAQEDLSHAIADKEALRANYRRAEQRAETAQARAERAEQALRKIVACDYRGNMPTGQAIALRALGEVQP